MNKPLFDESDDNSENGFEIKTNKDYANSYNHLRKKELLQKFNSKGLNYSESESSSDSDSSEEDEVLDPAFDQEFLKTLASLKSKDPTIYDKSFKFFQSGENLSDKEDFDDEVNGADESKAKKKNKKQKPVTLKDYERKIILEKGGKFEDESEEENMPSRNPFRPTSPTLVEEEKSLRSEFEKVLNENDSSDEEFGGIFKKRQKSKAEEQKEEEDYLQWLAGKNETINKEAQEKLKPLKTYWNNDKLPSSEKFLRDYILNKGYTDANNYSEIPTYEEIVGDKAPLSEDEEELEKQAEFEQKYNFRFEDPDQEFIKRYPRTVESSVRISSDKRKQKRQEIKERKTLEKEAKMKELEIVNEMRRKEIEEKIEKLKMVTGNDEVGFKDDDLEADFDPEAHDRRMQELFNDDYYLHDEGEEKPECPSDIDELKVEDWDNYNPQQNLNNDVDDYFEPHCEDDDFIMDCDFDPAKAKEELQKELIENTRKRKGRKGRRDRFMEIIKADKPVFNPDDEKTYGEYIDEYYKLDCEDIIGDTPCRFKYVETTPNDFGLTIDEILLAKNKELNQWASLKKAVQIRPDHVEKKEQRLYKLKAKNEDLKRKVFKSLYGEGSDNENEDEEPLAQANHNVESIKQEVPVETTKGKKRRKRKATNVQLANVTVPVKCIKQPTEENNANDLELDLNKTKNKDNLKLTAKTAMEPSTSQINVEDRKEKKNRQKKKNQNNFDNNNDKNLSVGEAGTTYAIKCNKMQGKQGFKLNKKMKHLKSPTANNFGEIETSLNNLVSKPDFSKKRNTINANTGINGKPKNKGNPFNTLISSNSNALKRNKHSSTFTVSSFPRGKLKPTFGKKMKTDATKTNEGNCNSSAISDERLKAYGINPKKFHKKKKYGAEV